MKSKWKGVSVLLALFAVQNLALYVSGVETESMWYPAVLYLMLFFLYGIYDFARFSEKLCNLDKVTEHIDVSTENLPEPENSIEEKYQTLLKKLLDDKRQESIALHKTQDETMEYITLWTHQIKTPLTALKLMADETDKPQKSEMESRLFEIEQYCDMMLQYLRLESESTDYVLQSYSVRLMVNQSVKYFARIFISKGISVHVDISEEEEIITDEKWMVFVLKQLISNALKYTEQGSVSIYMDENHNLVIEDTGIGIVKEDLPRIFERGYTGFNGRKDKKATGLGLFLVARIIKALNHHIEIDSEPLKGTKVIITF